MFITFEGPEGAGKSTTLAALADRLQKMDIGVLTTREPGAGSFGKKIRELLLHGEDLDPKAELLLFLADRSNHVSSIIRPALEAGRVVLCDRYADSTQVYQAHARGLNEEFVCAGNQFATGGLVPDLTLLFDLEAEQGLARIQSKDRLDAQPVEFHRRVRQGFLQLAAREPRRWRVIDASRPPAEVLENCWEIMEPLVQTWQQGISGV